MSDFFDESEGLPVIEGIDWEVGKEHFDGMDDLMMEMASQYFMAMPSNQEKIQAAYAEITTEDGLNNYRMETHSLKSTSLLIGAVEMSELAKACEFAAKESNIERIRELTPALMRNMSALYEAMAPAFSSDMAFGNRPVVKAEIEAISNSLRKAMSEMDIDTVDEKVNRLQEYAFGEEAGTIIEQLQVATMNLDSGKTYALLDELDAML